MGLTQLILENLGNQGLEKVSDQVGVQPQDAKTALEGIIPTILGAMRKNTEDPKGAQNLLNALDKDHDGGVLENVTDFISNFQNGPGDGILKHVLGEQRPTVEQNLGAKTGIDMKSISKILAIAAPLVMGYLGKQKRQDSTGFDVSNIASILGSLTNSSDNDTGLDLGDILSMVGGLTGNKTQSGGGLASIAGGILGKLFK